MNRHLGWRNRHLACGLLPCLVLLLVLLGQLAAGAARSAAERLPTGSADRLAQADEALGREDADRALAILAPVLAAEPDNARALLLRSTARFMRGELETGRTDLERAVRLDPQLRQAWLNLAALHLADQRYDAAFEAMTRARDLDPQAPENDLNLGAVELLRGHLQEASRHFQLYLARHQGSPDAAYLVATNYAMAGFAGLAVQQLATAIQLDERSRLRARTDVNFTAIADNAQYLQLLGTDSWRPTPGSYAASELFVSRYEPDGNLLRATVDALQFSGRPFDKRVEVTPEWALLWGEMRIKLSNTTDGKGLVEVSAPPQGMSPALWEKRTEQLFRDIAVRLTMRGEGS